MEKFADAATWGQMEYLKKKVQSLELKHATLRKLMLEWHDGEKKRRWMLNMEGKKVLVRMTFEKDVELEEEPHG